ncbi:MAG: hypothetical protein IKE46_03560 [Selenomonadaceae bacterium]|nr:hypothetical protein [Selenomonadaceae bacterium]
MWNLECGIWKFLLAVIVLLASATAQAEQPKAQEYRRILSSESFYVEYDDNNVKRIIAQDGSRRMARTNLGGTYRALVSVLNPLGNYLANENEKFPEFMYANGKYYKFIENDFALMLRADQLGDENLNPSEGWGTIYESLSLPNELAVLNWHDRFHKVPDALSEPVFVASMKKSVGGREYDCDRYEAKITNAAGKNSATIVFDLCYANGELALAQSALLANGREYEINRLIVKKILPNIPSGGFKLNGKEKVHAAGTGDMNDLLENPPFIGRLSEVQ